MSGAVDLLVERTGNDRVGVVGYCMGGGLALVLATQRPDDVKAVAPYYGLIPWASAQPDWSQLEAKVVGEYAELRRVLHAGEGCASWRRRCGGSARTPRCTSTRARPRLLQRRPPEVYSAEHALEAWERTNELFREELTPPLAD